MALREVVEQSTAQPASDGDGVKLLRVFGGAQPERFDPFLLMDEFGSEEANDYIGGFPPHPHRGFETITYMLNGKMEHRDHMENVGLLQDGDVQWMTAGKGIIHSEMPQQTEGRMRGFQIWLNLRADKKMQPANYKDIASNDIPFYEFEGYSVKAIAGNSTINNAPVNGYFQIADTYPLYLDLHLSPNEEVTLTVPDDFNTIIYVYEGRVTTGSHQMPCPSQTFSRMDLSGDLILKNRDTKTAKVIILAGRPLGEPIAQYGPFVMNTQEEIHQAISDYRQNTLTS